MLKRMWTAREAREMAMYDQRFPIDDQSNHQLPAGMLMSLYANAHKEKDAEPYVPRDFMPFVPEPDPDAPVNLDDKFRAMFARFKPQEEGSE